MRRCIICKKQKTVKCFNKEHIFPESIGGAFYINTVCAPCNSILGKTIDRPFLEHVNIGMFRNFYNLKSYGRKPGNPLKKFQNPEDGYLYEIDNFGINRYLIPKKKIIDGGSKVQMTIDKRDYNDRFLKKLKKRFGKEYKVDPNKIDFEVTSKVEIPETTKVFLESNRPLILEALKVAYEFTATYIPSYIDTPLAKHYAEVLQTGRPKTFLDFFLCNQLIKGQISAPKELLSEAFKHHFVIIGYTPSIGIVATVRFFNGAIKHPMMNVMIMATSKEIQPFKPLLVYNDFLKRKAFQSQEITFDARLDWPPIGVDSRYI